MSLSELRFLRSVPPFATDYKVMIDRYFANDPHDGRGLVRDVIKAYADPEFLTRGDGNVRLPWEDDDLEVVAQRYGDFPPTSAFELYWDVIEMLENEKIIKLYRQLQETKEVQISAQQKVTMVSAFEEDKIRTAEFFLLPKRGGKKKLGGGGESTTQ